MIVKGSFTGLSTVLFLQIFTIVAVSGTCTPPTVTGGTHAPPGSSYTVNETISYTCDTGYLKTAGDDDLTCDGTSWIGTTITCTIVTCPDVSVSDASKLPASPPYNYNTAVTYTCATGYYNASGDLTRTCTASGAWDGTVPTCSVVTCPDVSVSDASKLPVSPPYNYNTGVTYTCATGYYNASGDLTRTCTASGAWDGTAPTCSVVTCPDVSVSDASKLPVSPPYNYNTAVTYTCAMGYYHASGNLTRTCTASGAWDGTVPTCSVVTCPDVSVSDATKLPVSPPYNYNTAVTYTCATGYYNASGDLTRTCTASGAWDGTVPTCSVVTCPDVSVSDATKLPVSPPYNYNTAVTYTCDTGYYNASGDLSRTCTASGAWDGTVPTCSVVTCPEVSVSDASKLPVSPPYNYNTAVTYTCDTGYYNASGDLTRTCTASGAWDGTVPTCSVVTCPDVSVSDASKLPVSPPYNYNTAVTYTCDTGYYNASGDLTRTCTASSAWDGTVPVCSVVTCPYVSVSDASKLPASAPYNYNTAVTYTCDTGYNHNSGDLTRNCTASGAWDGTVPICSVVTCPDVSVSDASKLPASPPYNYNTAVTYTCDTGYNHASGDLTRTCTASGAWDGTVPTCSVVTCPEVSVSDASKLPASPPYNYNTAVTYTCDTGYYHASGDLTRTCAASGAWDGTVPTCSVVTCPDVSVSDASKLPVSPPYNYNTAVTYTCDTGFYHASGDLTRTCTASGAWDGTIPTCSGSTDGTSTHGPNSVISMIHWAMETRYSGESACAIRADNCPVVTCPDVSVSDASKLPASPPYNYNTAVTYTCDTGYNHASGDLTRTCTASGAWDGTVPTCSVVTCPEVSVNDASKLPASPPYNYNTAVTYTCDTGYYHASGDLTRTCTASGAWDGTVPTCSVVTCPDVSVNDASKLPVSPPYNYNTAVTYTCDTGFYHASGDLTRTCTASGAWDGTIPTCSVVTCPAVVVGNAARLPVAAQYIHGTSVTYTCDTGHFHDSGDLTRTCNISGVWDGTVPVCSVVTCPEVSVSDASKLPASPPYNYNTAVTYTCDTGYYCSSGDLVRTCQASGSWNGTAPTCSVVTCLPDAVAYSTKSPDQPSYTYSTTMAYTCDTGYELASGTLSRTCQADATWSAPAPVCSIKQCPADVVANSARTPDQTHYDFNTSVTYACDTGHNHTGGDLERTCQENKTFTGDTPVCTIVTCVPPEDAINATKAPEQASYDYNTPVTYTCQTGYEITAGSGTRTCLATQTWSGTAPTCTIKMCPAPAVVAFSDVSPDESQYPYSSTITYTCHTGYERASGNLVRTCKNSKTFGGTKPVCTIKQCDYEAVTNAVAAPNTAKYDYNTNVVYSCNLAFAKAAGDLTRTCDATENWTGTLPTCDPSACLPDPTANGAISPVNATYSFGVGVTYTCDSGYYHDTGDATRTCQTTGLFDNTKPTCARVECNPPGDISHGTYLPYLAGKHDFGTDVTYTCDLAFSKFSGDLVRTCQQNFAWSGAEPVCTAYACIQENSTYMESTPNKQLHDFNDPIDYACITGYNYSTGDVNRTCQTSGQWTGTLPTCVIVWCQIPDVPANTSIAPANVAEVVYNQTITYTCDVGYNKTGGDETRRCTETSLFDASEAVCTIVQCDPPLLVDNSTYSDVLAIYNYSMEVTYTCDIGYYYVSGDNTSTCTEHGTWTGTPPTCNIVKCAKPTEAHATVLPDQDLYNFNTTVDSTCVIGFNLTDGEPSRTCQDNATWSGTPPNCTIVECEMPAPVSMSTHVPQQSVYVYLDVINYTCDVGFEVTSGNASRECKETGLLTGSAPNCTIKHCVPPQAGGNATYDPVLAEHDWNTTVSYTCNIGYNQSTGNIESTCQDDKTWSGDALECIIVTCDKIDVPHMTANPNIATHDFNTTVEYACVIGYNYTYGDLNRTCNYTGQWTGDLPNCTIVECEMPAPVAMSTHVLQKSVYVYLDVINYTCDVGYEITSGNATRECKETGLLTGSAPNCTIKQCVPPQAGGNATYDPVLAEHDWNTTVSYTCNIGYNQSTGNIESTCQDDKMWSGDALECIIVTCDKIDVPHMTANPNIATHDFNTTVEYACVIGYNHSVGDLNRTCNYTGQWTGDLPNCTIVECDVPPPVDMSSHLPVKGVYVYLDVINYTCDIGYEITSGNESRECKETGLLTGIAPNCTIKKCVPPQAGVRTTYDPVLVEHDWNTTVSYTCNIGYNDSTGNTERRCQDDKTWSGDAQECVVVTCDNINVPFMTVTPSNNTLDFNTTIEYACVVGYNQSYGDLFRTCNYTGLWTGELPNCTIITCDPPAPISHTSYLPVQVEHDWNTDIEYSCHADYHYVSGINVTTCNETGVFPPVNFDCSVAHSLTAHASEPSVKWINSTANTTTILYDYDGYCNVGVSAQPATLDVCYEIKPPNQIEVTVEENALTDFREYKVILSPHKGARSWSDYKRTVFYGEDVLELTAWLDNPIIYLAVDDSYNFEVTATQGTTTTLRSDMNDGIIYTTYNQGTFPNVTVTHTYNTSGHYNAAFDLSNLVSSQSATVPVIVIYKLNNVLFRVDHTHRNTTTAANFEFYAQSSANIPMDVVNFTINYKHGSNDSGNLDLGDSVSLPASFPYSHLFDVQGDYVVEVATVNHVSSGTYSVTMNIWDSLLPLDFVVYNGTGKYITNTTAQFQFANPPDAGFEYIINFGDGTTVSSASDAVLYESYNLSIFSHVYTSANLYNLRWRAWNGWAGYNRDETFQVLVQNRVPNTGYTVEPIGKKYPWKNLQSMTIPVNITLNDTVPLPTDATCTFDPSDGNSMVTGIPYNSAFINYLHAYITEGVFNGTLNCSNEVSHHAYEFNLKVQKVLANEITVNFQELVAMNISGTREVLFYVDSGGYALIPEGVFLGWDFGDTETNARRRRAVVTMVPYNTSIYSHTYDRRANYTITVQVDATVTGTSNTLTYSLRVGIMYFEYNHVVAFLNDTVVNYVMYGVLGPNTYTLSFDTKTVDYSCSSTGYEGCNIPHMCPSYGYMLVVAIANNGSFVEVDHVNITCDNPIPPDMTFTIPGTVAIPDGYITYNFSIGPTDLFLPLLTCRINFGDPIYRKDVTESQTVTYGKSFGNRFQYIALGRHPIEITCWNLINMTTSSHTIIVTNKDFLFTGTFDRRFSQPETPMLISSRRDVEIFSRLVILANETEKVHYNLWTINATMNPAIYDRHSLLFTRGEIVEGLYQVILKVSFVNESSNSIFEPTWVKLVMTPPHAEIVGSTRRKVSRGTVQLDGGTLSYDPARPISPSLAYSWTCKSYDASSFEQAAFRHSIGYTHSACTTMPHISSGLSTITLNTTAAPQKPYYVVELTVNNLRGMTATFRQTIAIQPQVELSIRCMFNCLAKVAVTSDLQLVPNLDHNCPGVFTWEMQNHTGGTYGATVDLSGITKTGNTNRSLTIDAHSLNPGTWHLITLTAVIDGSVRKAYHEFVTNKPPKDGVCDVIPFTVGPLPLNMTLPESPAALSNVTEYYAGVREFNLTCKGWTDEGYTDNTFTTDEPLFYFFFLEYKVGDPTQRQILYYDPGSTSNLVTFQLGDPNHSEPYRATVVLRITDVFGDYAELRYDTISKPNITTGQLSPLNMANRVIKLQEFINTFSSNMTKAFRTLDYRTIARKAMDIASVYNQLELNTSASVTLTPEDLLSLGYKENNDGERISWSDYWRLIVEVVDTSTSDYLIQVSEEYIKMLYEVITSWPDGKKITVVAVETMSRALTSLMNKTDYTNVTGAKLAAESANILCRNLAYHVDSPTEDRPYPSTEMIWAAATAIRSLVRNIVMSLQAVLTPNLPEDPTVDEMRQFLEYMQVFKTTEEVASEPLSLQEQTFLAQKQLQKYYLAKYIKSEASKEALPNITEALRNLTFVFQTVSAIGQQEVVLEDDIIYVSTEIVPAFELQGFTVVRPRVEVELMALSETHPAQCNSSAVYIRTIIFKENPYFWGTFADRISSYVPVFELDGATIDGDTITFRLGNKIEPACVDATPTYEKDDPNKMIYILFDRKYEDDDILLFIRPNATDLVYQLYFNIDEKPVIEDNKYIYSTEIKTDKWTQEDGYKLLIKSTEFSAKGKIWIALRPLLEKSTDLDLLTLPFCANVTTVNCLAWHQDENGEYFWDKTLCQVSRSSSRASTTCVCDNPRDGRPMTVGTTFYVPPSKVDFKNLEEAIEVYGRTPVVAMIASTMIAYFLLVFWAWREDAKDQYKWSYALLIDNDIADSYFYIMKVYTGLRSYSGTQSKLGFILMGEDGRTRDRILDDESHVGFDRGSVRTFVMSTRRKLGDLLCLRVWHDDSGGPAASWYLNRVVITDLQSARRYFFECNKWFSYDTGDQRVDRSLLARPIEDMRSFKDMVSYTIADSHIWVSVFLRPLRSNFTRIQRLASLLGLIYVTMIVCIMILKTPDEVPMNQVVITPFRFSIENFMTAMIAVSVATLVIMVVTFFFRNAQAPTKPNDIYSFTRRAYRKINDKVNLDNSVLRTTYDPPAQSTVAYDYHFLPHFCKYIGWTILLTVIGITTYLIVAFSDDWKLVKSEEWMTSIFVAFLSSMVLIEPVKILVILLFYSVFCPRAYEPPDPYVDIEQLLEITKHNSATLMYGPQFENVLLTPVNPDQQTLAQNKIDRIRDHQLLRIVIQLCSFSAVLYMVYFISYQSRDPLSFYLKNHVEQLFDFKNKVNNPTTYVEWLNETFLNNYFSHTYYGAPYEETDLRDYGEDLANVRVGPARLRQLRILPESCKGPLGVNQTCYNRYRDEKADSMDFCVKWKPLPCDVSQKSTYFTSPAWLYTSAEEVWGFPTVAEYTTYGGGGYFMKLDVNMEVSVNIFKELVTLNWLDRATRAVILEFTMYNGNSNLFCYSKFVAEFPEVGGVVTYTDIQVFRLYQHYGPDGNFILFLEFIFLLCVIFATLKLMHELATDAMAFLKSMWNLLDLLALIMAYTTVGCYIYKLTIATRTTHIFHEDRNAYVGFENLAFYDFLTNTTYAILVFLLSMRVSRILGYSGKINEMAAVIVESADDLLAFLVIFAITYFAYVAYGTLLFGKETAKYRDMFHTYGTLTEAVVGKNRLSNILVSKPGFAEFYYFTFVLFVLMTLMTMAAAILNFSISSVKEENKKVAPTNIVEVIFDRVASVFRRLGALTNRKGAKYKPSTRRDSDSELNAILSELRLFLKTVHTNGDPKKDGGYRAISPDDPPGSAPPPVFSKPR